MRRFYGQLVAALAEKKPFTLERLKKYCSHVERGFLGLRPSPAGAGEGGRRPDEGSWDKTNSVASGADHRPLAKEHARSGL
jgi:hypothetical protein